MRDKGSERIMLAAYTVWAAGCGLVAAFLWGRDPLLGAGAGLLLAVIGLRVCWG